ncbi:MAG TPA: phosphoribosylglycinamide formyltransferase [Gammaproteobacteria bacterium]|nr:phosphoribosylglycinamide formyltransferase [Gammaproteobacteria bacterium]
MILISGKGSNLQAIIRAVAEQHLALDIKAVISNRPNAPGLLHAQQAGIATETLDHHHFPDRQGFDTALRALIDSYQPRLVVLAGFMRILSSEFVRHYQGRMLNIHPSLLPAFPGLNTHQRALQAGVSEHGASVHFVTQDVDGGPVVIQARIRVTPEDTPETLAARVLEQEHIIYPQALRWFAEGRLRLVDNNGKQHVLLDGKRLIFPPCQG